MPLFPKRGTAYDLALSMIGLTMGDRFLQIGSGDGGLFAALASKVGLTGGAYAVDPTPDAAAKAERAAAKAGVLVEVKVAPLAQLPYDPETFDLVVLRDVLATLGANTRVACVQEVYRVLRAAGRCLVIEPAERGGLGGLLRRQEIDPHYLSIGGAEGALRAEGFRSVRTLAERDGTRFIEGVKPRK